MKRPALVVPTRRIGRRITVVAIALVLLASLAALIVPRLTALPSDVAFRAAGTDVTRTELDRRTKLLASLYGVTAPADPAGKDAFRRESARAIATSVVLDRAAADRGIVISDKVARDALSAMIEQQGGPGGGRDAFVAILKQSGASEDDVLEETKRQKATEQLFDQIAGGAGNAVTPADVQAYYRDHPAEVTVPEQRHLRNVVVASEAEAADVARRVTSGEDFAAVAGQSSLDGSSRGQGGDLGFVERARLDPTYGGAAFAAAPHAVFGPVRSSSGWNVGQVLEVRPAVLPPFDQIRQALDAQLRSDRARGFWRGWMDKAVADADIRYADDLRPPPTPAAPPSPRSAPPPPAPAGAPTPAGAPAPVGMPAPAGTAATPVAMAAVAPVAPASGGTFLSSIATVLVLALAFVGVGVWGRQHLDELVPSTLSARQREKRLRTMRRGTLFCIAAGVLMVVLGLVGLARHLVG